jgi:hypothetical protein
MRRLLISTISNRKLKIPTMMLFCQYPKTDPISANKTQTQLFTVPPPLAESSRGKRKSISAKAIAMIRETAVEIKARDIVSSGSASDEGELGQTGAI